MTVAEPGMTRGNLPKTIQGTSAHSRCVQPVPDTQRVQVFSEIAFAGGNVQCVYSFCSFFTILNMYFGHFMYVDLFFTLKCLYDL